MAAGTHMFLVSALMAAALMLQYQPYAVLAQRSSAFSLQAAVDELHRREAAKYPLNSPPSQQHFLGTGSDQDYWDEDATEYPAKAASKSRNRHRLNKALAKYLERENYEAEQGGGMSLGPFGLYEFDDLNSRHTSGNGYGPDNRFCDIFGVGSFGGGSGGGGGGVDVGSSGVGNKARNKFLSNLYDEQKKRSGSVFRERDNIHDNVPASVFRERDSQASVTPEHSELAEQFLREIEETQEHEREENYKEALRNLWEKYQRQNNELDDNLYDEKQKRLRTPPYYMLMAKKRSYPVLPWLPYSPDRKKRFPVAKRSTKRSASDNANFGKTDEKVARELRELFGEPVEEKKKRSTDSQSKDSPATETPADKPEMRMETPQKKSNNDSKEAAPAVSVATHEHGHTQEHDHMTHEHEHSGHSQKEHKHRKRSESANDESYEDEDEDSDEAEGHDEHEDEEEDHDDFEDEDEEHKRKRSVAALMSRRKKSIDWSTYFGIDRKKKAFAASEDAHKPAGTDMKKRDTDEPSDADDDEEEEAKKKRNIDPEKLENMDKKLASIEDFIIDETIKYTGAHEGIKKPEEIRRLKDRVLSRLATAYSLEKMRRALEKLRQSVENENHLLHNIIESEDSKDSDTDGFENEKRVAVKKQSVEPHHNLEKPKELRGNSMPSDNNDDSDDDQADMMKKKKKRNGYLRYPELPNEFADDEDELGPGRYESWNDAYLGTKNYMLGSNQCPIIEAMADRCRGVDLLSGDLNQELLPICGVHQICYLCGTSQVSCDYQYLSDADTICESNKDCQAAARSVLMILRGSPGPQMGPRECLKHSCLYSAMREIGL